MATETHETCQRPAELALLATEPDVLAAYLELGDEDRLDVLKDAAVLRRRKEKWAAEQERT